MKPNGYQSFMEVYINAVILHATQEPWQFSVKDFGRFCKFTLSLTEHFGRFQIFGMVHVAKGFKF